MIINNIFNTAKRYYPIIISDSLMKLFCLKAVNIQII